MQVARIDHVHMEVADRDVAADWYERVLGLRRHPDFAAWADDPMGPLILAGGDGFPTLSLFARAAATPSRDTTVAFRVNATSFVEFIDGLSALNLTDREGSAVTRDSVIDHDLSWSIYFTDPDMNRLEITTYDYAEVAKAIA
ncbi:MAG: VOC family protein [Pseudomonadota bacterium]